MVAAFNRQGYTAFLNISGGVKVDYSIKVYKQYFNFSSSHFLIFKDGSREPLHGHNYRVTARGFGEKLCADMLFDFLDIKPLVRQICDSLDHRLLLPGKNPFLKIENQGDNYCLSTPDGSYFSIPKKDVLVMPLANTSVERLAGYIASQLRELVLQKFNFTFEKIEIEVEETPGQSATFTWHQDENRL